MHDPRLTHESADLDDRYPAGQENEPFEQGFIPFRDRSASSPGTVPPCPKCQSPRVDALNRARKTGGAIGTVAGTTSGIAFALSGAETGAAVGALAGPAAVGRMDESVQARRHPRFPLARSTSYAGKLACAARHAVTGAQGAGRLGNAGDGATLRAPVSRSPGTLGSAAHTGRRPADGRGLTVLTVFSLYWEETTKRRNR
jgi:hypothetical protein